MSFEQSAERNRQMVRSAVLRNTDPLYHPERLLAAHNIMSELTPALNYGFFLRFSAHFNLFCVNLLAVGGPEQVAMLDQWQEEGKLGCFALTERFAGVSSGLVVETVCDWDPVKQVFILHTPHDGAAKNWITSARMSDLCVVFADLRVGGKAYGPHGFIVELHKNGKDIKGMTMGFTAPTGRKTSGNDLDNVWMHFDKVELPKSALLNRYADIVDNQYVQKKAGIKSLDMMASLYTGRVEMAHSAVIFAKVLYKNCRKYTDCKACWAPKGKTIMLSEVPQLQSLYPEADRQLGRADTYMQVIERELCACLRAGELPSADLLEAISVGKVHCVELAITLCNRLKEEVGAFALMPGCGFEHLDHLYVCRFIEGDSRILKRKLSRDTVKNVQKGAKVSTRVAQLCKEVTQGTSPLKEFELAEAMCQDMVERWVGGSAKL